MGSYLFICAGDASGDTHAASLIKEIRDLSPDIHITALGGGHLKSCSDEFLEDLVGLSAFGFWSPLKLYFRLKDIYIHKVKPNWDLQPPSKVILVDYYGFNIHLAREAHRRRIPVYYYISPQVWATRPGRVKKLARYILKMLVILPFEEDIYRSAGVDVTFVGHPLVDSIGTVVPNTVKLPRPLIGLYPGSRPHVAKRHIPLLLETAHRIQNKMPADFVFVGAPELRSYFQNIPYPLVSHDDLAARAAFSLAITTSGTVSLENALLGVPMIVFYRLSAFNYLIARILITTPYITMVNILLGKSLIPEFIQSATRPALIADEAIRLLSDSGRLLAMKAGYKKARELLGSPGVSKRAAHIILDKDSRDA